MSAPRVTPGRLLSLLAIVFLPLCHDSLRAEQVVLSRLMPAPAQAKPEYIEFYNNTSNPFDIAKWRLSEGVTFEFAEFSPQQPAATFLHPFERIVLTGAAPAAARQAYAIPETVRVFGPWDGQLKDQGERVTLRDKNGGVVCTVKYGGAHWPDLTAGQPLVLIDPNQSIDDWRNWTVGQANTRPGTAPVPQTVSPAPSPEMEAGTGVILVDYASAWRFNDSGQPGSAQWTQPRFDDSQWRQGLGLLAFDQKPLPKPGLRTRVNMRGQTAFYFRTAFQVPAKPTAGSRLLVDQIVDDGAVYYLNGKEVARSRMPTGRILAATLASSTVPTAAEEMSAITLDSSLLNSGTNVLAVEVHQSSPNSSDIVFGARLRLTQPVQPGLVINEVFAEAQNGFVEFCNNASQPLNLKGCFLSDTADQFQKYSFREDVVVAAGGLTSVSLAESGLAIANPLTVYFTDKDGHTLLSAVTVSFAEDGRSIGRRPQGGSTWFRFPSPSRNQPNQGAEGPAGQPAKEASSGKPAPVVINEIMYDPPYHAEGTEFVELFNRSPNQVDLSRWRFTDGIEFTFPAGTSLAANSYAVVAADQEATGTAPPLNTSVGQLQRPIAPRRRVAPPGGRCRRTR
ncbi:MAG: lamin tail domain-containing protein [Verrucomicrobiota bacterium]